MIESYLNQAREHETAFRLILDAVKCPHKNMNLHQIYTTYSEGDRTGQWTIIGFGQNKDGSYYFSSEDIAFLSGSGSSADWIIEDGKARRVPNTGSVWMS